MTASALAPFTLHHLLGANRWIYATDPFPHVVAYDVFSPEVYRRLSAAFDDVLASTAGRPYMQEHGIHGRTITPEIAGRFEPLVTRPWHDLLAAVLGIEATGHLAVGLHHHRVGSGHGFPHNDLNPGWFLGRPAAGEVLSAGPGIELLPGTAGTDGFYYVCLERSAG